MALERVQSIVRNLRGGNGAGRHVVSEEAQIARFDDMLERYCRRDPVKIFNDRCNEAVASFNSWSDAKSAELDKERAAFENNSPQTVEAANAHNVQVSAYNRRVAEFRSEQTRRKNEFEALKRQTENDFEAFRRWLESRGPEQLSNEINRCYAALHQKACREQDPAEVRRRIERVAQFRAELAAYAQAQEKRRDNGLLIVPATANRSEQLWLIVDSGSTTVSVTPEIVKALGIEDRVGDEVEVSLAGGLRIRAPRISLPYLSVHGVELSNVEAVVLHESHPGVDGCLGMSFLNRVTYRIENGRPQTLVLDPGSTATDLIALYPSGARPVETR